MSEQVSYDVVIVKHGDFRVIDNYELLEDADAHAKRVRGLVVTSDETEQILIDYRD